MSLKDKLDDFFRKKKGAIPVGAPLKPMGVFPLIDAHDVVVDILDYGTPNEQVITLAQKLQGLGSGGGMGVGISKIAYIDTTETATGDIDNYQITFTDSEMEAFKFSIRNGKTPVKGVDYNDGAPGIGIADIKHTATEGLEEIYTITLTDGSSYNFTVKNGTSGGASVTIEYNVKTESMIIK